MIEFFIIAAMVFMHILDDFHLQGILASMKQREWWKKEAPEEKYKLDYILALLVHGFEWSFLVMLPMAIYVDIYYGGVGVSYFCFLAVNTGIHAFVDHAKCNMHKINLIQDQAIHLAQILLTAAVFFMM